MGHDPDAEEELENRVFNPSFYSQVQNNNDDVAEMDDVAHTLSQGAWDEVLADEGVTDEPLRFAAKAALMHALGDVVPHLRDGTLYNVGALQEARCAQLP